MSPFVSTFRLSEFNIPKYSISCISIDYMYFIVYLLNIKVIKSKPPYSKNKEFHSQFKKHFKTRERRFCQYVKWFCEACGSIKIIICIIIQSRLLDSTHYLSLQRENFASEKSELAPILFKSSWCQITPEKLHNAGLFVCLQNI